VVRSVVNYAAIARAGHRELFVVAYSFPFLVGVNSLATLPWRRTETVELGNDFRGALTTPPPPPAAPEPVWMVFAVRKVQDAFPSMITVGRSPNNDVVIEDLRVSKFHAYFRQDGNDFLLVDAGSQNGTFVGEERLAPKAAGAPVKPGNVVGFGPLRFEFLDAGGCFDKLRGRDLPDGSGNSKP
jgi:pSer/pThr/pTyr-binding forkhead associated (FHA) protein